MLTGTAAHLLLYTYLNQLRRHGILKYICLPYNFYIMAWYYVSTQPRVPSLRSIFLLYPLVPLQVHFLCYLLCCRPGSVICQSALYFIMYNSKSCYKIDEMWSLNWKTIQWMWWLYWSHQNLSCIFMTHALCSRILYDVISTVLSRFHNVLQLNLLHVFQA